MEYSEGNIDKLQIYVNTSPDSGRTEGYGFVWEGTNNRQLASYPQNDFFIPVFITKTESLYEYVDITHDETIFTMQRQEFNPFFIEFGFFDTIKRNKANNSSDLTLIMLNYIRAVKPDVSTFSDSDLRIWFDTIGRYDLPWNPGQPNETSLDTLDKISLISQNIISKAKFYNIDINN